MAEINLEDLMKNKAQSQSSESTAVIVPEKEIETVTQQVETLSPEEQRKVEAIKNNIDLMDTTTPLKFGVEAQKEIAQFSDSILSKVRNKDSGQVGELLNDLVGKVRGFDPSEKKSFLQNIPILGGLVNKAQDIKAGYDKLSTQVDVIEQGLERSKVKLMEDVVMFDTL